MVYVCFVLRFLLLSASRILFLLGFSVFVLDGVAGYTPTWERLVVAQSPAAIMCVFFFKLINVYYRILLPTCFLMSLVGDVGLAVYGVRWYYRLMSRACVRGRVLAPDRLLVL